MMRFVWKNYLVHIFQPVNWKSLNTVSNPVSLYLPKTQIMFFKYHFSWKKSGTLEKCLIPSLDQEI